MTHLWEWDNPNRCMYCGVKMRGNGSNRTGGGAWKYEKTRDHLVPRSWRKSFEMSDWQWSINTVPACAGCNKAKGRMHPLLWYKTLDEGGQARMMNRMYQMQIWGSLNWPRTNPRSG